MNVGILYTGGKDSSFALYWALLQGFNVKVLLSIIPTYDYSLLYHRPLEEIITAQSKCLGIPVLFEYVSHEEYELEALKELFSKGRDKYKIRAVFSGALLSDYQRIRYSLTAEEVGLKTYTPLWRINQEKYLIDLIREGFEVMIISINTYGLPSSFLGRILSLEDAYKIIELSRKYGFNPAFEGGEAETLVTYMPFYKCKLVVDGKIIKRGPFDYYYRIDRVRITPISKKSLM